MRCLNRALSRRSPEVINSDQGSHFANEDYLKLLKSCGYRFLWMGRDVRWTVCAQSDFSGV